MAMPATAMAMKRKIRNAIPYNINFKVVGLTGLWLELSTIYLENLVMFVSEKNVANTARNTFHFLQFDSLRGKIAWNVSYS